MSLNKRTKHTVWIDEETYGMLLLMKNAYSIKERRNFDMNDIVKPAVKAKYLNLAAEMKQNPDLYGNWFGFRKI